MNVHHSRIRSSDWQAWPHFEHCVMDYSSFEARSFARGRCSGTNLGKYLGMQLLRHLCQHYRTTTKLIMSSSKILNEIIKQLHTPDHGFHSSGWLFQLVRNRKEAIDSSLLSCKSISIVDQLQICFFLELQSSCLFVWTLFPRNLFYSYQYTLSNVVISITIAVSSNSIHIFKSVLFHKKPPRLNNHKNPNEQFNLG